MVETEAQRRWRLTHADSVRATQRSYYVRCIQPKVRAAAAVRPIRPSVADRFWAKVDASGDCWEWTAAKMKNGYGAFTAGKLAHRLAYELLVGPIPEGLTLDHLCRSRSCVNPDHLEPVTRRLNIQRGFSPSMVVARRAFR